METVIDPYARKAIPMDLKTLETLLKNIHQGDDMALAALYDHYAGVVYSVAFQVLEHQQDAEEITQDVFLRLWHKSEAYDANKGPFMNWLLTITRRLAIDALRRRYRVSQVVSAVSLDEFPTLGENLVVGEDLSELQHTLLSTLRELPIEYREAIQLAYFRGMTHEEVARHLDKPLGTVKTHIRQGMEKLRAIWITQEGENNSRKT